MNAPSFAFIGFGVISALVLNLIPALRWRRVALLAANLAFFGFFAGNLVSVLPYVVFMAIGYGAMMTTSRQKQTGWMLAGVIVILLLFFWLKRYGFIPPALFLPFPYVAIGLSYVFFRVLHLVIESGPGGSVRQPPRLVDYLNYTLHFPALISGPIQLYPDFLAKQREERLPLDLYTLGEAAWRIIFGFFKVAIISTLLMAIQKECIASLPAASALADRVALSAVIWAIYPLFLYANFSGYTDFVIGIAALHRFKLPENFDNPFVSENFISFWARWHISLSSWLKTYVYMPILIQAMRRYPSRKAEQWFGVLAYFVTFFLVGAWHGQTSMFLFFGVLQGGGVAINKLYQNIMTERLGRKAYRALCDKPIYRSLSRAITFAWFAFTLIWFWSSWEQLTDLLDAASLPAALLGIILVVVVAAPVLSLLAWATSPDRTAFIALRYRRTAQAAAMVTIVTVSQFLLSGPAPDIVYRNF